MQPEWGVAGYNHRMVTREQLALLSAAERQLVCRLAASPDLSDSTIPGHRLAELCTALGIDDPASTVLHLVDLGLLKMVPQETSFPDVEDHTWHITAVAVRAARLCRELPEQPPKPLATELTSRQLQLLEYLWLNRSATFQELQDNVWGSSAIKDDTIRTTCKRLNARLHTLSQPFWLTCRNSSVSLEGGTN